MRFHGLLGERKFSWTRHCCHRKLRRPEFPGADRLGVGAVTPPLGLVVARYPAHTNGEAGVTTSHLRSVPGHFRKSAQVRPRSVLTPETDIVAPAPQVRKVP